MLPESLNAAYIEAVKACGGSKVVGVSIWPAKGLESAQRHLLACLNEERNEKLSPDEALHIERLARERGCHVVMEFRAASLGYSAPNPIEPEDERAKLHREFIEASKHMARLAERIELVSTTATARGPRAVA